MLLAPLTLAVLSGQAYNVWNFINVLLRRPMRGIAGLQVRPVYFNMAQCFLILEWRGV